jgi:hypothetical protein
MKCPPAPEIEPMRDKLIKELTARYGPDLHLSQGLLLHYKKSWRMVLIDAMRKDGVPILSAIVFDYTKVGPKATDIGPGFIGPNIALDHNDPALANKVDAFIFDYIETERMREHKRAKRKKS